MIAFISPAKRMSPSAMDGISAAEPLFSSDAHHLMETLRTFSPWQLESPMKINAKIAMEAFDYFQDFDIKKPGTPALLTYSGLQFKNLDARSLTPSELQWAQEHLCILSGLYGIVRPLDGIQPYRLEMQCPIPFDGMNLYEFWGQRLYDYLFRTGEPVLNLASKEYSKAVTPYVKPEDPFMTCDFFVSRAGKLKMQATDAKMARGQMVRYIIQNRIQDPRDLLHFSWEGYQFAPEISSPSRLVFIRQAV